MVARPLAVVFALLVVAAPSRAAALDPYLPADTETYVSVNLRQILDSSLVKDQLLPMIKEALGGVEDGKDLFKDLGIDPLKHLNRLIIATPSGGESDRGLFIIHGTFDPEKIKKKAASAAKDNEESVKIHKAPLGGGVTHEIYEIAVPGSDMTLFVTPASKTTLLASMGKDYVVDALKQVKNKKKPALKSKSFQTMLEKMDAKPSVCIAVPGKALRKALGADNLPRFLSNALEGVEAIGGGITFGTEIKMDLTLAAKDGDRAATARKTLDTGLQLAVAGLTLLDSDNKQVKLLQGVLKTIKVGGKGKVVSVSAKVTADVLKDALDKDD